MVTSSVANSWEVVMGSWSKFMDPQDLVPVAEKNACCVLLWHVINKKKSSTTNLMNLYSWDIYSLWMVLACSLWLVGCSSRSSLCSGAACMCCVPWLLPVVMLMQHRWFMTFRVLSGWDNVHYKFVSFQHWDTHTHSHCTVVILFHFHINRWKWVHLRLWFLW